MSHSEFQGARVLIAMTGQVASGKSSVARAIAHQIAAPIVHSDAVRDFLVFARSGQLKPSLHESDWAHSFRPSLRAEVYDEVFRRAEKVLASGRPVVVDGCFGTREQRARVRELARRFSLPFFFVECDAAEEIIHQRLRERAVSANVPVQAWRDIAADFRAKWEPVDELREREHIVLDTGKELAENVEQLEALLPAWPIALQ